MSKIVFHVLKRVVSFSKNTDTQTREDGLIYYRDDLMGSGKTSVSRTSPS